MLFSGLTMGDYEETFTGLDPCFPIELFVESVEQEDCDDSPRSQGNQNAELTLLILPYFLLTLTIIIIIFLCCRDRLMGGKSQSQTESDPAPSI